MAWSLTAVAYRRRFVVLHRRHCKIPRGSMLGIGGYSRPVHTASGPIDQMFNQSICLLNTPLNTISTERARTSASGIDHTLTTEIFCSSCCSCSGFILLVHTDSPVHRDHSQSEHSTLRPTAGLICNWLLRHYIQARRP